MNVLDDIVRRKRLEVTEHGRPVTLRGFFIDITAAKRAEEQNRQSEQFIRGILDSVDEGFIVVDRDYRILTANAAYCSQAALSCEEVTGRRCHEISHKNSRPCHEAGEECAVRRVFETGQPHAVVHKHPGKDGRARRLRRRRRLRPQRPPLSQRTSRRRPRARDREWPTSLARPTARCRRPMRSRRQHRWTWRICRRRQRTSHSRIYSRRG